jgi:LacI family transcriptional regulator
MAERRELIRKVRSAARKLGYQPNLAARDLRVRSTRTLGMVFPDIENPFPLQIDFPPAFGRFMS